MSAQYRPYRDEEGLDDATWTAADEEQDGAVQIYERTPCRNDGPLLSGRSLIVGAIALGLLGGLVGFLLGFFFHTAHSECIPSLAVALNSVRDENPTIRSRILEMVDPHRIRANIKTFSSHPHVAGSQADFDLAEIIRHHFEDAGLESISMPSYQVLLSESKCETPNYVAVLDKETNQTIFTTPQQFECNESSQPTYLPPFSAYAPESSIVGDLVYVNYGRWSDLHHLQSVMGLQLEGKILIARQLQSSAYEQAWNARLVKAAGLLLYPDPLEYNHPDFNTVSHSWWLPGNVAKSESVLRNNIGDPLTPGYPATEHAYRLPQSSVYLPLIPVQPISADDAYHILSMMGGPVVEDMWRGGFELTYRLGPGFNNSSWHLNLEVRNQLVNQTIHNVIGYIRGKVEPDRYILVGSHRDSWGYGAVDSASGTASLVELAHVYGELLRQGWRPRRTIVFCSWGAEKFNLIGSTEWLEENIKVLHERAIAYISTDEPVLGNVSLSVASSPLLYAAVFNATQEVPNPNLEEIAKGASTTYDSWLFTFPHERNASHLLYPDFIHDDSDFLDYSDHFSATHHDNMPEGADLLETYMYGAMRKVRPRIKEMDSKSSYSPFFLRAGIPSVQINYIYETTGTLIEYPLQDTPYDNFQFMEKFLDPGFKYHAATTKIIGELLRDLADSLFVPFNVFNYAQVLRDLYYSLQASASSLFKSNGIDLDFLDKAISNFTTAALNFHSQQSKLDLSDPMAIRRINDQLLVLERAFLDPNGLPNDPFKRHIILSPSDYPSGHTGVMFPGLLDEFASLQASENSTSNWETIRSHYAVLVYTIRSAAATLALP